VLYFGRTLINNSIWKSWIKKTKTKIRTFLDLFSYLRLTSGAVSFLYNVFEFLDLNLKK